MNKHLRAGLLVLVLFLSIGFATVTTNLFMNSNATIAYNQNDFQVIFTKAVANKEGTASISDDGKSITYTTHELVELNDQSILDYKITNNSSQYDADINISVKVYDENNNEIDLNEYFTIEETIQPTNTLEARTSTDGQLTVTLTKQPTESHTYRFEIVYDIDTIERASAADGTVIPNGIEVTFDANGGVALDNNTKMVMYDALYGDLPETTAVNLAFEGWYTDPVAGEKVTADTVVSNAEPHTLYAHYTDPVAVYNTYGYNTLQKAINAVPKNGIESTVDLLKSSNEDVNVFSNQNIILNMNNNTLTNTDIEGTYLFTNEGELTVNNGIINASTRGINNSNKLILENMTIDTSLVAIYNAADSNLNIKSGSYNSGQNSVINDGVVSINGGNFTNSGGTYPIIFNYATLDFNDGTLNSTISRGLYTSATGTTNITGGTITGETTAKNLVYNMGVTNISGGNITAGSSGSYTVFNGTTGTMTVSGGSYSNTNATIFMNQGTMDVLPTTVIENSPKTIFAANGSSAKTTIKGGTYSASSSIIYPQGSSTVIVEDGTYTSSTNVANCNGGNLTIEGGNFTATASNYPGVVQQANGSITINGGTINTQSYALWAKGKITLNGGTVKSEKNYTVNVESTGTFEFNGGTLEATSTSSVMINSNGITNINGGNFNYVDNGKIAIINRATGTMTINEGADITIDDTNALYNYGTFNLNGGTISTNNNYPVITTQSGGTTNINSGTINGNSTNAIVNTAGTTNIKGGSINSNTSSAIDVKADTVNITGGTISSTRTGIYAEGGTTNISGGTITSSESNAISSSAGSTVNVSGGQITNESTSAVVYNKGTTTITGGSINSETAYHTIYNEADSLLNIKDNADIKSVNNTAVTNYGTVMMYGGNLYSSSDTKVTFSQGNTGGLIMSGGTITTKKGNAINILEGGAANITGGLASSEETGTAPVIYSSGTLTISDSPTISSLGNNRLITISSTGVGNISGGIYSSDNIYLDNAGELYISDGFNVIDAKDEIVYSGGKLDISGGVLKTVGESKNTIYIYGGTTTIHGGTIESDYYYPIAVTSADATVTIDGGNIKSNENASYAIMNGGTLEINEGANISTAATSKALIYGSISSKINLNGGTFNLANSNSFVYSYGEVRSNENVNVTTNSNVFNVYNKLIITGGNYTSTKENTPTLYAFGSANVTITGGTFSGVSHAIEIEENATADISNANITSSVSNTIYNYGNLTIGGTSVIGNTSDNAYTIINDNNGSITINDGTITSAPNSSTINNLGTSTMTINGGNISSTTMSALSVEGGTVNITGGTFSSAEKTPTVFKGGTINISGGTFTGNSEYYTLYKPSDSTAVITITGSPVYDSKNF